MRALSIVTQTENIVASNILHRNCTLDLIALTLGQNKRTLQHQLQGQGTSYKEILQKTRLSFAIRYLTKSQLSISEISDRLGFTNRGNFTRFMKQQTGNTPKQIREESVL